MFAASPCGAPELVLLVRGRKALRAEPTLTPPKSPKIAPATLRMAIGTQNMAMATGWLVAILPPLSRSTPGRFSAATQRSDSIQVAGGHGLSASENHINNREAPRTTPRIAPPNAPRMAAGNLLTG